MDLETARNREHPLIAGFSLVLVADVYMSLFGRVRLDLGGKERVEITTEEAALAQKQVDFGLEFGGYALGVISFSSLVTSSSASLWTFIECSCACWLSS